MTTKLFVNMTDPDTYTPEAGSYADRMDLAFHPRWTAAQCRILDDLATWLDGGGAAPYRTWDGRIRTLSFNMGVFVGLDRRGCGMPCCIAGFIAARIPQREARAFLERLEVDTAALQGADSPGRYADTFARDALGLRHGEASRLFTAHASRRQRVVTLGMIQPHQALRVVRRLAVSGEVDWEGTCPELFEWSAR